MTTETKHTPPPYAVEVMPSGRTTITSGQLFVAGNDCDYGILPDDAAFIVRACNSHDKLVKALKKILGQVDYMNGCCSLGAPVGAALPPETIEECHKVLAAAQVQS